MDQFGISEEMTEVTDDDLFLIIEELKEIKKDLSSNLRNIRFKYDKDRDIELHESVIEMYGLDFIEKNGAYITFDMFSEMLDIVKLASESKADQLLGRYII
jgi:hypothetical protein